MYPRNLTYAADLKTEHDLVSFFLLSWNADRLADLNSIGVGNIRVSREQLLESQSETPGD